MADWPDESEPAQRSSRKSRTIAACERCRKRKQRCDSKLPTCGPCDAAGVKCIMSDRLVIHADSHCDCASLRQQNSILQAKIKELAAQIPNRRESILQSQHEGEPRLQYQHPSVDPPRYEDAASMGMAYSGRILRPTFMTENTQSEITEALGSAWNLWHNDISTETPGSSFTSIDQVAMAEYADELLDVFFENYWPQLPILHRQTFLENHFRPVVQGTNDSQFSKFQVYMVLAIASCQKAKTTSGRFMSHRAFFDKAIDYLGHVLTSPDLDCIQCLLLLCMYGRNEPQRVNMWHTTGLALRTALGIDLHRQESIASRSFFEAEMAKRLFWSAYVMDRSMALAMSRPLGVDDASITLPLPVQHTDEQLSNPAVIPVSALSLPDVNDTSTFIHVIKLRRLNARIYRVFHSAGETPNRADLEAVRSDYQRQLNEWLVTAPRYMMSSSMFQSPEWFQIAYHHAILNLYRPSHATPLPSYDALRLCADSAISLIVSYASLYAKNKVSYSFIALTSIFMAAVTMLYSLRASPFVRQNLSRAVTEANINTCLTLFRGISNGRDIAEKCSQIVARLGTATLALFDKDEVSDAQVDTEFLTWFGLKSHCFGISAVQTDTSIEQESTSQDIAGFEVPYTTPSVDSAWGDVFAQGFDFETLGIMDFSR